MSQLKTALDLHIENSLRQELTKSSTVSVISSLLLIAVYQYTISYYISQDFTNLVLSTVLAVSYLFRILWARANRLNNSRWLFLFSSTIFIHGVLWASILINVLRLPHNSQETIVLSYLAYVGLVAASALSIGISRLNFFLFTVPIITSLLVSLYEISDKFVFSFGATCYVIIFVVFSVKQQMKNQRSWSDLIVHNFELQNIIDTVPGGILVVKDEVCIKSNKYIHKLAPKLDHSSFNQLSDIIKNECFNREISDFSNSEEMYKQFEVLLDTNTEPKHHLVSVRRSIKRSEKLISVLDIDQLKKIEHENNIHKIRLISQARMISLGEMAGGIAHEINNPLAIIYGNAQQLLHHINNHTLTTDKLTKSLETMNTTSLRISGVIKSLRDFAKDSEQTEFEKANLRQITSIALSFNKAKIENSGVFVENKVDANIEVECIPAKIKEAIYNVVNNSFESVIKGHRRHIKIETSMLDTFVVLKITDSGGGIPQNIREKVFQPFFSTKDVGQGTGLGLSVAKGIIEQHHGEIYFNYENENECELVIKLKAVAA